MAGVLGGALALGVVCTGFRVNSADLSLQKQAGDYAGGFHKPSLSSASQRRATSSTTFPTPISWDLKVYSDINNLCGRKDHGS